MYIVTSSVSNIECWGYKTVMKQTYKTVGRIKPKVLSLVKKNTQNIILSMYSVRSI